MYKQILKILDDENMKILARNRSHSRQMRGWSREEIQLQRRKGSDKRVGEPQRSSDAKQGPGILDRKAKGIRLCKVISSFCQDSC